jgi:hypothetical protein
MKRRSILAALAVAACLLSAGGEAFAQGFSITITVDENGNGTFTNTNGFFSPLPATLLLDGGPGGLPAALTYGLLNPPGLVVGDLLLFEPGPVGVLSDLIRFNPNGTMVFYSDNTDGAPSLADTGFPTALYANNLARSEVGPEGNNGFVYTPTAGQPGFVAGAAGPVTYVIRSDVAAIPEPGPLALCGLAALAGLATRLVRRKRAA